MIAAGFALAGPAVLVSSSSLSSAAQAGQGAVAAPREPTRVPVFSATIVARYPHDRTAFTEGLLWHDGALYESTGQERQSDVRRVSLKDGKILARARIDPAQFGEGLALWKDQLVSLTWHDGIAHRWDVRTLKPKGQNRYTGEGWGLTSDGVSLLQSDGSPDIIVRDPLTLAERKRVRRDDRRPPVTRHQRTRICPRRAARQRLAHRLPGPHRSRDRQGRPR